MKSGWATKRLGDLCVIKGRIGYRGYTKQDMVEEGEGAISLSPSNIVDNKLVYERCTYISWPKYEESPEIQLQEGDIVYCKTASIGKIALVEGLPEKATINPQFVVLKDIFCANRYLYHYLTSPEFRHKAAAITGGTAIPTLSQTNLAELKIPLAPRPEQQRIVGILDEAFEGIATAKANAEKNLQNARSLFESHLQSVFTNSGEGWVEKRLGEVAKSISTGPFGTMLHKSDYVPDGIPLVNPMNIVDSKIVPSSKMMVNEETRNRLSNYVLKPGDVVIGRRGELGRCAPVTEREAGWLCGTGSFFVRLSDAIDGEFFVALFGSAQFKARLEASAVGTTMSSLNHGILNDLVLPVPPIAIQRKIINKARELLSETQRLKSIYQQKLVALEALKKSLLDQAFAGEL